MKNDKEFYDVEFNGELGNVKIQCKPWIHYNKRQTLVADFKKFLDSLDIEIYNTAVEKFAKCFDLKKFSDMIESDFPLDNEDLQKNIIAFKWAVQEALCDKIFELLICKLNVDDSLQMKPDHSFSNMLEQAMRSVEECVKFAETNNLTNTQDYINWENDLNMYSCKEHPNDFIMD